MIRTLATRLFSALALVLFAIVVACTPITGATGGNASPLAGAAKGGKILEPDKLIILSTVDVKGKTSPCG